jgi:hypothetical protein
MSRPWEYPRWRRVLMQAVMWVIFAAALGLANLITYHRAHTPVELAEPINLHNFRVSLPDGWDPTSDWDPDRGELDVIDPERTRGLNVSISKLSASSDDSEGDNEQQVRSRSIEPVQFSGLHQKGIMAIVPRYERESGDRVVAHDVLVALTVLPKGEMVKIELRKGGERIGPSDRMLVQAVANAITRKPPRNTATRPGPL